MKRFTDAGRRALADDNLYAALSLALSLPDICSSIENPGPGKSKNRYIKWCKAWVEPKFTHQLGPDRGLHVFLSAEDCYKLRCSLVHSGSAEIDANNEGIRIRAEFFDATVGAHLNSFQLGSTSFLQLRAADFSDAMFTAADEWDASTQNDKSVQAEKAKLLVIHSAGAIIQGVKFG